MKKYLKNLRKNSDYLICESIFFIYTFYYLNFKIPI